MKPVKLDTRRTKIVGTIGPATSSLAAMELLLRAGMNIARLNLSHGTHSEHAHYIHSLRKLSQRLGINVAILIDLPGPKYRIGRLNNGQVTLKKGARVALTTRQGAADSALIPVNLPHLHRYVKPGTTILLADGAVQLRVEEIAGTEVTCQVTVGGVLTEGDGLVVPGMPATEAFITDALREHLHFAIQQQPDYLALSFVSSADDINQVRALLNENNSDIPIIAKIERIQAVKHFDSILSVSDGIMVARGDLGVDIPLERIPLVQKEIIRKCNQAGKPVITATEMLESMVTSARPTRAEVTDVANAIFDGTDATMLSAETAVGKYPVAAVKMMARIAREVENKLPYERLLAERGDWLERQTDELIGYNACYTAQSLGAAAIVALTASGSTAGRVSKYRPRAPILALTISNKVARRLLLRWGVHPVPIAELASVDELFAAGVRLTRELGIAQPGDLIVITGGIPIGIAGTTNLLKVERVT